MIIYDDFAKLELKIGKIVEAAEHSNADKLLVLKVEIGDAVVQVVAGIKAYYGSQEVVGKQVVVLANLEPRQLRGIESQGMILAAQTPDKSQLCLIVPEKEMPAGSIVK